MSYIPSLHSQEYNFKNTVYFNRLSNDSLISTGRTLASFDFNTVNRANDSLFHDGIYFPANDCFGRNLWIRVRHIANDPNGQNVGINVPATYAYPCASNIMIGGWAGFLYDFEIHRDQTLTGNRANFLGALYPTSITVASLETLSGTCGSSEWISFVVVNSGSTGWSLNSINFTGSNTSSNPAFSDTLAVYTTGGCFPPDGFSYTFPTGSDSISFLNASCCGFTECKMSAGSVSHFQYGYEYSGLGGGYQGMSMAFGSPPTYTFNGQDVTCQNGNDGVINVNISGGIGPFTYEWSDSTANGNSLTGLSSGTYRLTVIDQNGCGQVADTTIIINEPTGVTVALDSFRAVNVSCHNANDGSIVLFASGVSPITYQWNNLSGNNSSVNNLSAGNYSATVTDNNSCLVFSSTITQPDAIDISTTLNGRTITANETGATFQWLNCNGNTVITDSTSSSFSPTVSGSYSAVITKNGCTDTTACVTISIISSLDETIFANSVSIYPNPANGIITIDWNTGSSETEITITDISGRVVFSKTEMDKTAIQLNVQQAAGVYVVAVKTQAGTAVKKLVIE
jgi:hypothetical protein